MSITSVSIVTITQYSRFDCLKNLYNLILLQDYATIDEWIIVEGSQTEQYIAILNKLNMRKPYSSLSFSFILTITG